MFSIVAFGAIGFADDYLKVIAQAQFSGSRRAPS